MIIIITFINIIVLFIDDGFKSDNLRVMMILLFEIFLNVLLSCLIILDVLSILNSYNSAERLGVNDF